MALQATSHVGARPFNKAEIQKISRAGTCLVWHAGDWVKLGGNAPSDALHTSAIQKMCK